MKRESQDASTCYACGCQQFTRLMYEEGIYEILGPSRQPTGRYAPRMYCRQCYNDPHRVRHFAPKYPEEV
jgi:hypothetical protein